MCIRDRCYNVSDLYQVKIYEKKGINMKIGVVSLGCCKNLVDSERMMGLLRQSGHEIVSDVHEAEAIIVNTCGFIEPAKEEAINTILELSLIHISRLSGLPRGRSFLRPDHRAVSGSGRNFPPDAESERH